jgi:hypothetical protein
MKKTQQHYFFDGIPLNVIFMLRAYAQSRYSKGYSNKKRIIKDNF